MAERTRTRRPKAAWNPQDDWLPLRFSTRLRFHQAQELTREKNYYLVHLFLLHSAYRRGQPFSDPLGVTSQEVLGSEQSLAELANQSLEELAEQLDEWSGGKLDDPLETAQKLQQIAQESFQRAEPLLTAVHYVALRILKLMAV